ncbi:hypothetical protein EJP77_16600 [Paenibacillus zeisoli]|uniref:Uncharacterized protein n=1 Tax=Paenibacillus zeisoli TaxID=2496267 RepID=A0A433X4K7_9BACL|nr:hypothetical protein [Paenibacillus zeisoli]RUT29020.1 hypothetical protein EJP77_16600 [Paenibacillus zeisoli]
MVKAGNKLFAQGRIAVFLFLLTLLAMFVINVLPVPNSVSYIQKVSHSRAPLPDTLFYYSSHRLYDILDSLGATGREAYRSFLRTIDAAFPLLYSSALALSIRVLVRLAASRSTRASKLYLLPLLAGLFDYIENLSILVILSNYPEHLDAIAAISGCFTPAKWLMSFLSLTILVIAAVLAVWRKGDQPFNY